MPKLEPTETLCATYIVELPCSCGGEFVTLQPGQLPMKLGPAATTEAYILRCTDCGDEIESDRPYPHLKTVVLTEQQLAPGGTA